MKSRVVFPVFRDVTDDEAFVDELRVTLRFFAAVLVRRTQKVRSQNMCGSSGLIGDALVVFISSSLLPRWMWRPSSHKSYSKFL